MKQKTKETGKKVAIGGGILLLGLYLFSKVRVKGGEDTSGTQTIPESLLGGLGNLIGGTVENTLAGAGDLVTNVAGGIGSGVGKGLTDVVVWAPATLGSEYLAQWVNLTSGGNKGDKMQAEGLSALHKYGWGVIFKSQSDLDKLVSPNASPVVAGSGYSTLTGLTYIAPSNQSRAGQIQSLSRANPTLTAGDLGYLLAVQDGKDVSNWNLNSLSPAFRNTLGR
jgi:hypothetical protein